jgi:hypothetical protein
MRKLFVLTVMALAVLALASTASAAPVEVEDDSEGVMCDDTVAGECPLHLASVGVDWVVHTIFGEIAYDCNLEIDAEIHSNGAGSTHANGISWSDGATTNCNEDTIPCETPWPLTTDHAGSMEQMHLDICFNPPLIDTCEGELHANLAEVSGEYSLSFTDIPLEGSTLPRCEYTGTVFLEDSEDIEIHHL